MVCCRLARWKRGWASDIRRQKVCTSTSVSRPSLTRFAKALKKSAKKAVTLRGDACAMCLACLGLVDVLSCCRVVVLLRASGFGADVAHRRCVSCCGGRSAGRGCWAADRCGVVVECGTLSSLVGGASLHTCTPAHCVGIAQRPASPSCVCQCTARSTRGVHCNQRETASVAIRLSENCLSLLKPLLHRALGCTRGALTLLMPSPCWLPGLRPRSGRRGS